MQKKLVWYIQVFCKFGLNASSGMGAYTLHFTTKLINLPSTIIGNPLLPSTSYQMLSYIMAKHVGSQSITGGGTLKSTKSRM
jgi:hypothetical protein